MRLFQEFNQDSKCPICQKNTNKQTVLCPIPGTQDGNNIEAQQYHVSCLRYLLAYLKENDFMEIAL